MTINDRINAFKELGERISEMDDNTRERLHSEAAGRNPWFTARSIDLALEGIQHLLKDNLEAWALSYTFNGPGRRVGVVMAGNIPAVGFHDLLCVLVNGHTLVAKLSNKDRVLINFFVESLCAIKPEFQHQIRLVDQLKDIDAVIATGSDNTARYFEYYFSKYPHIIRKNRTSVAIIQGDETEADLDSLAVDIFSYYGLGCRNVSKLFVPKEYDLSTLLNHFEKYPDLIHHHKYRNNYDYYKSIYLVNKEPHLDNGVLLLKEDPSLVSPISVVFYEYYENVNQLDDRLNELEQKIQCTVSKNGSWPNSLLFGRAQFPGLRDYADGVDTMQFLAGL